LTLKELATKKNDHIKALEFYKYEMLSHIEELKNNRGSWSDILIIWFENIVSEFGTNPFRPLLFILIFNFIFLYSLYQFNGIDVFKEVERFLTHLTYIINPTTTLQKVFAAKSSLDINGFFEFANFIKNIFVSIFIYESIKSFRKYSRKL